MIASVSSVSVELFTVRLPSAAECPKCGTTLWVKALIINVCGHCEHKFYVKTPRELR